MDYWEFPRCREAFALGQADARPEVIDGCYYRRRGRTHRHMTLLSFEDANQVWAQMQGLAQEGARVQCVNYTKPMPVLPGDAWTRKGPVEWWTSDFPAVFAAATGSHGKRLRQYARQASVGPAPTLQEAIGVFDRWAEWAKTRHFMVFKGHYLKWLRMYYDDPGNCKVVGVYVKGALQGLFGWETVGDTTQITIAKHTEELEGKALWVTGLMAIGAQKKVLCGSTADKLKLELGLTPMPSWTFDLSKLNSARKQDAT